MKALAIVAVVFTHAGSAVWMKEGADLILTRLWTPFHVPSFLFVSGFLSARRIAIPFAEVRRRLGRVLVPYVVASLLAVAVGVAAPRGVLDFLGMLATVAARTMKEARA